MPREGEMKKGYIVADVDVRDPAGYEEYRRLVLESIAAFGGRYIVRAGRFEVVEGDWTPKRIVVIEFDSMDQARAWWASEAYREARDLRQRLAVSNLVVVEGA